MTSRSHCIQGERLPLRDFIAARNALVKTLRADGERDRAERVARLSKPSVAAWLVNRLFHDYRRSFDELLATAELQRRSAERSLPNKS